MAAQEVQEQSTPSKLLGQNSSPAPDASRDDATLSFLQAPRTPQQTSLPSCTNRSHSRSRSLRPAIGAENLLLWKLCSSTQPATMAQPNSSDFGLTYSCCRFWWWRLAILEDSLPADQFMIPKDAAASPPHPLPASPSYALINQRMGRMPSARRGTWCLTCRGRPGWLTLEDGGNQGWGFDLGSAKYWLKILALDQLKLFSVRLDPNREGSASLQLTEGIKIQELPVVQVVACRNRHPQDL